MKKIYSMLFCMLIFNIAFSQEKNEKAKDTTALKIIEIDEVLVVGNAVIDPVFSTVSNNYAEKIVQPKNVAELFESINGISTIKRGSYAMDPSFRAAQYEQLNIMYDGGTKAVNACPNRMDPITTHVTPEEVSKIEIIKGPYSVRYGATFGGIINVVTSKPSSDNFGFQGNVSGGYETNGNSYVTMLGLQQATNKYDIAGNFGYRDYGNYKDGGGTEIPSSFRSTDYGLKFGYNFTDDQRVKLSWKQSFGRDVQHAGLPMDTDYDNSSILSLDYNITLGKFIKKVNFKAYYSYVDHLMNNKDRLSFMMTEALSPVEATTVGGKLEFVLNPSNEFIVYSGFDFIHIAKDGVRNRLVKRNMNGDLLPEPIAFVDKIWQDSYVNDMGVFTEAKWFANNSITVTGGIRYDLVISDIQDPEEDFAEMYDLEKRTENNLSGTVSLRKIISDNLTFEAAFGRGVRSANLMERYINHFNIGQDPYEYIGNPNLKAEINNQFEVGIKGQTDLKKGFNKLSFDASVYYSILENLIVAQIDETLFRKFKPTMEPIHPKVFRNIDDAYKTGFELMARLDFLNDFYFKTELAYVYTENKDNNESIPLTPPLTTRLFLGFEKDKYWINGQYNIVSEQTNIAETFGETTTDGWSTFDIKFGIKPIESLTFGVAVLNVFDEEYNNHLNFSYTNQEDFIQEPINDPGINFTTFIQYRF
ncbi:MAG: TonB-dependent receptor [Flavobacteriaceae bacterium]